MTRLMTLVCMLAFAFVSQAVFAKEAKTKKSEATVEKKKIEKIDGIRAGCPGKMVKGKDGSWTCTAQ
jgi:hypothetical protein